MVIWCWPLDLPVASFLLGSSYWWQSEEAVWMFDVGVGWVDSSCPKLLHLTCTVPAQRMRRLRDWMNERMNALKFLQFSRFRPCATRRSSCRLKKRQGVSLKKSTFYFILFLLRLHSFTKDIQQRRLYLKEVGWWWGGSARQVYVSCLFQSFWPLGTTQPWGNLCDEESNKYLSKLGGQIGAQLQLVDGGGDGNKGRGEGSHNVCCIPKK